MGLVVSQGKMKKTVKVRVQTKTYDKSVHKEVVNRKDYLVHDQGELCKEGDIVRIEAIPKISARKYFAVAEIKVNKGQQFALYEKLASEKVEQEEQLQITKFFERRQALESTITHIDDLRSLDKLAITFQNDPSADRQTLLNEINRIKLKYNIKSWPSTEPILKLEIREESKDLSVLEHRVENIKVILEKLFSEAEYSSVRDELLTKLNVVDKPKPIQKNIVRKYILNPKNECPILL